MGTKLVKNRVFFRGGSRSNRALVALKKHHIRMRMAMRSVVYVVQIKPCYITQCVDGVCKLDYALRTLID